MTIVLLEAENVKRLKAVSLTPKTVGVVEVTGKNRQGKTSLLDAIWWAIQGVSAVQGKPIRDGESEATIRLKIELPDTTLLITRRFKGTDDGGFSPSVTVRDENGTTLKSPQAVLSALVNNLTFEPLALMSMPPKEQMNLLKSFVSGVDFAAIDAAYKRDFEKRTDLNRRYKELDAQALAVEADMGAPAEPIDTSALMDQMAKASETNTEIEGRRVRRENAGAAVDTLIKRSSELSERATALREEADKLDAEAQKCVAEADELEAKIAAAPALPSLVDVQAIRAEIAKAEAINIKVGHRRRRLELMKQAKETEAAADGLTKALDGYLKQKADAIAAAKLPVKGLGFGDDCITLNGIPFDQSSDAERLEACVAIGTALNPKLRIMRVRDGSLMDDDAMARLSAMAERQGMQVWVETVQSSRESAIVIHDGAVVS